MNRPAWPGDFRVLDPALTAGAPRHPDEPGEVLPEPNRAFKYLPTLELLRPGDLVLVSNLRPGFISRAIVKAQKKAGFAAVHAMWHHAAVYLGDGLVCEAQGGGVVSASLYKYLAGGYLVRFLRAPDVDELQGCKIALAATLKLKYGYNRWAIWSLLRDANIGWNGQSGRPKALSDRATICSQLYADAYGSVTFNTLEPQATAVAPAHLSRCASLDDLPITWLALN